MRTAWLICSDPKYEEEVSGCTASVGIISRDKIWVVCALLHPLSPALLHLLTEDRQMQVTRGPFLVSRVVQSHFLSTISRRMKVCAISIN